MSDYGPRDTREREAEEAAHKSEVRQEKMRRFAPMSPVAAELFAIGAEAMRPATEARQHPKEDQSGASQSPTPAP